MTVVVREDTIARDARRAGRGVNGRARILHGLLAEVEARPGEISGTVVQGPRRDWLGVEAEIRTDEDPGEVIVNYLLSYDAQTLPPRS